MRSANLPGRIGRAFRSTVAEKRVRRPAVSGNRQLVSRGFEVKFWALVVLGICVPALGTVVAVLTTAEPDIADGTPIFEKSGAYVVLNWSDLERHQHALRQGTTLFTGARVRALGYMMDGDAASRPGESVRDFLLLPNAGNLFHAAHRFGDQMIAVHLASQEGIPFSPRSLVWVEGILRTSAGDPAGPKPLYDLEMSSAQFASKSDIRKYFR